MVVPLVPAAIAIARQQALKGVGKLTTNPMYKGMGADPFMSAFPYMMGGTIMAGPAMNATMPYLAKKKYEADQQAKQHAADVAHYNNTQAGQESMQRGHANSREMLPIGTEGYAAGGLVLGAAAAGVGLYGLYQAAKIAYTDLKIQLDKGKASREEVDKEFNKMKSLESRIEQMQGNPKGYAAGGLVGGIYSTESLDLPAGLQQLMPRGTQTNNRAYTPMQDAKVNNNAPMMDFRSQPTSSYAMGGQVGPGGAPVGVAPQGVGLQGPGQAQGAAPMDAKTIEMHIQRFIQENPGEVEKIKWVVMEAIKRGELTQEELNTAVQLATVAIQNPAMYPQVVQFAVQQGIVEQGELDAEYDQGLAIAILLAARAAQSEMGGNFMGGGEIMSGSTTTADDVNINVSKGEFVIPAHVVKAKGTDFFEKMIDPKGGSTKA